MAKDTTYQRDLAKLTGQLEAYLDPKRVHKHLIEHHGDTVKKVVIGTAKAGVGPGNKPYADYKPSYKKQLGMTPMAGGMYGSRKAPRTVKRGRRTRRLTATAGAKLWLVGLGGANRMLDPKNFSWEIGSRGECWLVWDNEQMAVYANVHQGTKYGGKDHTKGHIPARPFNHFANPANASAAYQAYEATFREMAAEFNAGRLR